MIDEFAPYKNQAGLRGMNNINGLEVSLGAEIPKPTCYAGGNVLNS